MNIAALSGVAAKMALTLLVAGRAMQVRELGAAIGVARPATLRAAAQEVVAAGLAEKSYGERGSLFLLPLSLCHSQGGSEATDRGQVQDQDKDKDKDSESRLSLNLSLRRNSGFVAQPSTQSDLHSTQSDLGSTQSDRTQSDLHSTLSGLHGTQSDLHRTESVPGHLQRLYDRILATDDPSAQLDALAQLWVLALSASAAPQKLDQLVEEAEGEVERVADMVLQVRDRAAAGATITHPFSYILKALRNQKIERPRHQQPADDDWGTIEMTPELAQSFAHAERVGKQLWGDD